MKRLLPAIAVALVAVGVLAVGATSAGGRSEPTSDVLGPGPVTVHLTIRHSRFGTDHVKVRPGTTVTFVVDNQDPIGHELIVGDAEVHRRHESGSEPAHAPRPGEVTIPALTTEMTVFDFPAVDPVGSAWQYACHLPGHLKYGMSGFVEVVA
jgi:plastocyanin